jgi:hypothetical protein
MISSSGVEGLEKSRREHRQDDATSSVLVQACADRDGKQRRAQTVQFNDPTKRGIQAPNPWQGFHVRLRCHLL